MKRIFTLFCIQSLFMSIFLLQANNPVTCMNYLTQLDSLAVKYGSDKLESVVTYDSNGSEIRRVESYDFEGDKLVSCVETAAGVVTKYNYGYDDCGNQILYEISRFIPEQNAYSLTFKEEWIYDNSGGCSASLLTSHFYEGIPETETTVYKTEKNNYEYFPNGNIRKFTKEDDSGAIIQEMDYTNDADGKTETIISKNMENSLLTPTAKIVYTYFPVSENINHFKTETIYRYDNDTEMICMKTTYDPGKYASDKLFTSVVEYYDTSGSCINKEIRTSKYSDGFNSMEESEVKIYDENDNLAATIEYDDKGDVVQILKAATDTPVQNSVLKGEWSYDDQSGIDTYSLKDTGTNTPLWSMSVYYIIQQTITTDPPANLEKSRFAIYPNPVKDNLFIEYSSNDNTVLAYFIYNLTGKLQLHGIINSEKEAIPVQSLLSGSYIISFAAGDRQGTSVFIKN